MSLWKMSCSIHSTVNELYQLSSECTKQTSPSTTAIAKTKPKKKNKGGKNA